MSLHSQEHKRMPRARGPSAMPAVKAETGSTTGSADEDDDDLEKGWLNTDGLYPGGTRGAGGPARAAPLPDAQIFARPPQERRRALFQAGQRRAFVVRVPVFLAEAWTRPDLHPGETIGELHEGPSGRLAVRLPQTNPRYAQLPYLYKLRTSRVYPLQDRAALRDLVFMNNARGDALAMCAPVAGELALETDVTDPENLARSQAAISRPIIEREQRMPTVKAIDEYEEKALNIYQSQSVAQATKRRLETKKRVDIIRKERLPRPQLLEMLFRCFAQYEYWAFRSLQEHTQQPQQYLKEILGEIAFMVRRGPYNGKYTLKPEFKDAPPLTVGTGGPQLGDSGGNSPHGSISEAATPGSGGSPRHGGGKPSKHA